MRGSVEQPARILVDEALRLRLGMALRAERIAFDLKPGLVRPMTVETCHTGPCHLALLKRAILEDLVEDLPVREIEVLPEQVRGEIVEKGLSRLIAVQQLGAPGMAGKADAGIDFRQTCIQLDGG